MSLEDARRLEDPKVMRALAHPVRLQVLEVVRAEGPITATEVAERIGDIPANCSFHLRTLAKYGFVEEAGRGKGRIRYWREVAGLAYVDPKELSGDQRRAADAMLAAFRVSMFRRIEQWAREMSSYPRRWQSGIQMEYALPALSPEELEELQREFAAVLERYATRSDHPRGARPVTVAVFGFPTRAPDGTAPSDEPAAER
ncbi:winged helix-turn-helix domain-containing protein [Tenggerimyces flavus]|uniref:ArsR/SmtB family transcription factor n=1 Tax=Tenggerimyces flavus TaxID=1708749 RepID=A0ABV7YLP7_9ACTN|nr:helix-turn-helix domain-containing protein [Tenggerimyces flavus]MBM7784900.1 DNA-binding transcriptional ArsR family regulator [Tenggerimyces flavus]